MSGLMCACDDAPPTEFFRETTHTARKRERHCQEEGCEAAICVGTKYVYMVGKAADGSGMWDFSMCLDCQQAWHRYKFIVEKVGGEECNCLGQLRESIEELFDQGLMDDMRDDEDVKWLIEKGYIPGDAYSDEVPETQDDTTGDQVSGGYTDPHDRRQLALALT